MIAPYYEKSAFEVPPSVKKQLAKAAAKRSKAVRLPIIMYHYVDYVKDVNDLAKNKLTIGPGVLRQQLHSLAEAGYRTYFVKDIPAMVDGTLIPEHKSVILTFDDGYEDFYIHVLPLLKRYRMKATLYVIYNYIGRKGFLNVAQLRAIVDSGLVEIGAHTLNHLYLAQSPKSLALEEINLSKQLLEQSLGVTVNTFAYPYGAFDVSTLELVEEATYSAAVSVIPGVKLDRENIFFLPRIRAGALGLDAAYVLDRYYK